MQKKIPFYKPCFSSLERQYLLDAFNSSWISSCGEFIDRFEYDWSQKFNYKHSIAVNNGTAACHLALLVNNIGKDDEVIVPTTTFIATANAVKYCGASPVFVDIDSQTWNLDCSLIEKAITPKTKAIFCVHLYGNPCNIDKLQETCKKYNLILIEDCCEAIGAKYFQKSYPYSTNKYVGNFGKVGVFSLYGNKTLTSGEGGIVVTNDDELAEKVKLYKGQGQTAERYWHSVIGYNYRMTNLQAAIGLAQLHNFPAIFQEKERVYAKYRGCLSSIDEIFLQQITENGFHGMWAFVCYFFNFAKITRVKENLTKNNIEWRPIFYPIHTMKMYKDCKFYTNVPKHTFSHAEMLNRQSVLLPSYPELKNSEIEWICDIIKAS